MPVEFSSVFFSYSSKPNPEKDALKGVSFRIDDGSFTAIVGRTGCGKSTLVQQINALLRPYQGEVRVGEFLNCADKKKRSKNVKALREQVGLVFQFPEYQLFEDNVLKDVMFGPKNFGKSQEEAREAAIKALEEVGLDESFGSRSPFELSGGEKRRVAIAGILAMSPSILVVDEPTAGLDPVGSLEMMDLFEKIHQKGTTVILVTHDMNLVLDYCDRVIVMDEGKIAKIATPQELFQEDIDQYSLDTPLLYSFAKRLSQRGMKLDFNKIHDISSLAEEIAKWKKESHA